MKVKIDSLSMGILVDLLAREVSILRDECDYWDSETKRRDNLLAEKTEIIKMLGQQAKAAPKKRGRPRGSKKGKTK